MFEWLHSPDTPQLEDSQIHLWLTELVRPPERVAELRKLLSDDERQRADRFHFEKDRIAYTIGRGTLRTLIAAYLSSSSDQSISPIDIAFTYNKYGRPTLENATRIAPHLTESFEFNISHSGELVLYGFTLNRAIGVDIEWHRDTIEPLEIAKGFFSPSENRVLNSLPTTAEHYQAFYNCWTRKEAYIKAHGMSLSMPLDSFDVTLAPGERACLQATRPNQSEVNRWIIDDIPVPAGYTAAIALERRSPAEAIADAAPSSASPGQGPLLQLSAFRL